MASRRSLLLARCLPVLGVCCLVFCVQPAIASPVGVNFTVSGSSGAWILDFSVTNNLNAGQGVYFFGVALPAQDILGSPTSWINCANGCTTTTWNPALEGNGGPNMTFNNLWLNHLQTAPISFGATLSGFDVEVNTVTAPTFIDWFAYGADLSLKGASPYLGGGEFTYGPTSACIANGFVSCLQNEQENPGFAGTAFVAGATPEPSSLLLLGTGLLGLGAAFRRHLAL